MVHPDSAELRRITWPLAGSVQICQLAQQVVLCLLQSVPLTADIVPGLGVHSFHTARLEPTRDCEVDVMIDGGSQDRKLSLLVPALQGKW